MPTYTKSYAVWKDLPDQTTPLTAAKLQNMDDGIATLYSTTQVLSPAFLPSDNNAQAWPDAAITTKAFLFEVPATYASGNLTFKMLLRQGSGSGTVVFSRSSSRFRDATAVSSFESGVAMNQTLGDTNSHAVSFTINSTNFVAGDGIRIDLQRDGPNASDTMAANLVLDGVWVEYQGN